MRALDIVLVYIILKIYEFNDKKFLKFNYFYNRIVE